MLGTPAPTYQQTVGLKGAGKGGWVVIKDASSRRWSRQSQGSLCGVLSIQPWLPRGACLGASPPAWTTAVTTSWLSPSFLLSPSNPHCLPQPEQSFQTINQITSLPTPLLPQLPIICRREAKPCPQQGPGLPSGKLGRMGPWHLGKLITHPSLCPPGSSHTASPLFPECQAPSYLKLLH